MLVVGFVSAGLMTLVQSVGVIFGLLQFAAFADWGAHREFTLYTLGIIWHILQAGLLFVMLVWIPRDAIDIGSDRDA